MLQEDASALDSANQSSSVDRPRVAAAHGSEDHDPGAEQPRRGHDDALAWPGRPGRRRRRSPSSDRARCRVGSEFHRREFGVDLLVSPASAWLDGSPGCLGPGWAVDHRRFRSPRFRAARHLGRRRSCVGVAGQALHSIGSDRLRTDRQRTVDGIHGRPAAGERRFRTGVASTTAMGTLASVERLQCAHLDPAPGQFGADAASGH